MCSWVGVGGDGFGRGESSRRYRMFVTEIQRKSELPNRSVLSSLLQKMRLRWITIT